MWSVVLGALIFCVAQSLGVLIDHSLGDGAGVGASLSSVNNQRDHYAQAFPYTFQDDDHKVPVKGALTRLQYALSPVLLPPPPPTTGEAEADQYYYPYYYNTQDNVDQYYYPYYYNTEDNADLLYKPYIQELLDSQDQLPQHTGTYNGPQDELPQHAGLYDGPQDQVPQHAGLYDGVINPQENMIFDLPKILLKRFN